MSLYTIIRKVDCLECSGEETLLFSTTEDSKLEEYCIRFTNLITRGNCTELGEDEIDEHNYYVFTIRPCEFVTSTDYFRDIENFQIFRSDELNSIKLFKGYCQDMCAYEKLLKVLTKYIDRQTRLKERTKEKKAEMANIERQINDLKKQKQDLETNV